MKRKIIRSLAAWRPFSFLDRFVKRGKPYAWGWTERTVDACNQVGMTEGLLLTDKEMELRAWK